MKAFLRRRTPCVVGLEAQHPTGVDLHLVARLAVRDRHGGRLAPEAELLHSESVQRRVRHARPCDRQQTKDLGQAQTVLEMGLDVERSASQAHHGSPWGCAAGCLSATITAPTRSSVRPASPSSRRSRLVLSRLHVAPYGLRIEPELRREALLRDPADPSS
jgi:hypothetical protein